MGSEDAIFFFVVFFLSFPFFFTSSLSKEFYQMSSSYEVFQNLDLRSTVCAGGLQIGEILGPFVIKI